MALEISVHELFLMGVSANSLTYCGYSSIFLYYILYFLFKTIYVSNGNLLRFSIKIISASYLLRFLVVVRNISNGIEISVSRWTFLAISPIFSTTFYTLI